MRSVDAAILAALSAPSVRCIYFVRLHFDSDTVAWHSGFGIIALDGYNYVGTGILSSVSVINEDPGVRAASVNVGLSGVPESIVTAMLNEFISSRSMMETARSRPAPSCCSGDRWIRSAAGSVVSRALSWR